MIGACAPAGAARPTVVATAWPEAAALFHKDPRWLGADAAYSVPLSADRTLWLFGDTFIATSAANLRTESKMVRNTVAVQTGTDPTAAAITFHWRESPAGPTSFLPDEAEHWYWPAHGLLLDERLILFFARIKATPGKGLGFEADGWRAVRIDNPDADPRQWTPQFLDEVAMPPGLNLATALVRQGDQVFGLAVREPGDHAGFLARWEVGALAAGRLDAVAWWNGTSYEPGATPAVVLADAGPECSLHLDARLGKFVHVRSDGFGKTTVVVSFADRIEGPWSPPRVVYRPPENDRDKAFVYAAKAHPSLAGADLVATYATNTFAGLAALLNDSTIYYPRFVKLTITP